MLTQDRYFIPGRISHDKAITPPIYLCPHPDPQLKAADKLARLATKKVKKQKLQYRRLARSMSQIALSTGLDGGLDGAFLTLGTAPSPAKLPQINVAPESPAMPVGTHHPECPSSPMMGVLQEVLAVTASPAPLPAYIPALPNTRHTHAGMLLDRQSSIDGVMEVTRRQKRAELNWVRKAKSLASLDWGASASLKRAAGQGSGARRGGNSSNADKNKHAGGDGSVADNSSKGSRGAPNPNPNPSRGARTLQQRQDQKLLERQAFGPYPVKELLGLLRAFQSMPQVFVAPKTELVAPVKEEALPHHSGENKDDDWDDDWEGYDDYDEAPIDAPRALPGGPGPEELAPQAPEDEDPAETAARQALSEQRQREADEEGKEREAARQLQREEDEAALAELHHSEQVVAISIKLQPLLQHPFIRQRPGCRAAMEKYLAMRAETERALPHNVVLCLADLLACAFPLMKPDDRRQCLRFFVLHTPSEDVAEAAERGVTVSQLKKLRDMFVFFDKVRVTVRVGVSHARASITSMSLCLFRPILSYPATPLPLTRATPSFGRTARAASTRWKSSRC